MKAHQYPDEGTLIEVSDRVIKIMRTFNNLVENEVALESYKITE